MSDGVSPANWLPQRPLADLAFDPRHQEQVEAQELLRQAFEQMLLAETFQMMGEALSK